MSFSFFNDTSTPEIYTLSLHDALPISIRRNDRVIGVLVVDGPEKNAFSPFDQQLLASLAFQVSTVLDAVRSEEHTSELQSLRHLVCRLLLEKKKNNNTFRRLEHT